MLILVDTNILVRAAEVGRPDRAVARDSLTELRLRGHRPCIVPQVVYEFWSVATRPLENNGLAMTVDDAAQAIRDAKRAFYMLRDERGLFERWEALVVEYDVKGKAGHGARLVAAMQRHGMSHLLTFNTQDFARYADIVAVSPADAAKLPAAE
jgi:predicted nucleic acid-binding protein